LSNSKFNVFNSYLIGKLFGLNYFKKENKSLFVNRENTFQSEFIYLTKMLKTSSNSIQILSIYFHIT
jgi:hypothetical protein